MDLIGTAICAFSLFLSCTATQPLIIIIILPCRVVRWIEFFNGLFLSCHSANCVFVGVEKPHMLWIIYGTAPAPFSYCRSGTGSDDQRRTSSGIETSFCLRGSPPPVSKLQSQSLLPFLPSSTHSHLLLLCAKTMTIDSDKGGGCRVAEEYIIEWTWGIIIGIVICGDWMAKLLPIKFACSEIGKRVASLFKDKSEALSCYYRFRHSIRHWNSLPSL